MLRVADVWFNVMPVASCAFTVTAHRAETPLPSWAVTMIVALPGDFAVTRPLLLTVATLVLLDVQVTDLLLALLGRTVAVSW